MSGGDRKKSESRSINFPKKNKFETYPCFLYITNMIVKEINDRRAYRAISAKHVPDDVVERLLDAAVKAPSCANKQPWRFLVLNQPDSLQTARKHLAGGNYWAGKSPLIIAAITREDLDAQLPGNRNYAFFDTGMACMNLQLQATKEGLISHPIAGFDAVQLRQDLGISEDYTLLTLIILGYPGNPEDLSEKHQEMENDPQIRKPLSEVVVFNKWEDRDPVD